MALSVTKKDWLFLLVCFGLGVLADVTFLRGQIGVSYVVFITAFYLVVFWRFGFGLNHRRIGLLLMAAIWMLSSTFLIYDQPLFHQVNVLVIPVLVFAHLVLITQANTFVWETPRFVRILVNKLGRSIVYVKDFIMAPFYGLTKERNPIKVHVAKQVFIGLIIGLPLLFIIFVLLVIADDVFLEAVLRLPKFMFEVDIATWVFRFGFVVFCGFLFFGIIQLLALERGQREPGFVHTVKRAPFTFHDVMVLTILVLMVGMYSLFFGVKFTYLFDQGLASGFTYSEYARRGFYELLAVVFINWTVILATISRTKHGGSGTKLVLKFAYSLIILASGALLVSAFQRLSMYEAAYGFTLDRFLAHALMIFLLVIFAYTFIRVWLEHLALLHFYLIVALIFFVGVNMFNVYGFIVEKNLSRYDVTGDLDVDYFMELGYTGWTALLEIDSENEEIAEEVAGALGDLPCYLDLDARDSWQAYNFQREAFWQKFEAVYDGEVPVCGAYERGVW